VRVHIVCEKHLSVRARRKSWSARLWVSCVSPRAYPCHRGFSTMCTPAVLSISLAAPAISIAPQLAIDFVCYK